MNNTCNLEAEGPRRGSSKEAQSRETPIAQGLSHTEGGASRRIPGPRPSGTLRPAHTPDHPLSLPVPMRITPSVTTSHFLH